MARRENHGSWKTVLFCLCVALLIQAGPGSGSVSAQTEPKREVVWPGITSAGTVLLPNGWSLKPAGRQTRLGDFPVQIAVHPTEPILAIAPRRLRRARGGHRRRPRAARSSAGSPCPRPSAASPGRPTASSSTSAAD